MSSGDHDPVALLEVHILSNHGFFTSINTLLLQEARMLLG